MPKIKYVNKRFHQRSLKIISHANAIIKAYMDDGFTLTLRQLYYQFVARDLIPNTQRDYKNLGALINDARLAGLIDWHSIEDRTRNVRRINTWGGPEDVIDAAVNDFRLEPWADQKTRVEVWIEKDALVGVIKRICDQWRVPYYACRGYTSQSEQWAAAQRIERYYRSHGQATMILHLGDHDPSGIDMTRDNGDRLAMFTNADFEVHRIALNEDQVLAHRPPPNPAKMTDSRYASYVRKFGRESWELDALEPKLITSLIDDKIKAVIDQKAWDLVIKEEEKEIKVLTGISNNYDKVANMFRDLEGDDE